MKVTNRSIHSTLIGFVLGVVISCACLSHSWSGVSNLLGEMVWAEEKAVAPVETKIVKESPPFRGLDSNLYMQTSGEYRACCYQAFAWADRLVADQLSQLVAVGDSSQSNKPAAVVFDLDETVLDNGRFQTKQVREGWAYDIERWSEWEHGGGDQVGLIPGALEFIQKLETLGIQRVYITNRNERARSQTLETLNRLGVGVDSENLLCADATTGSSKDSRRAVIEGRVQVLLYVGDNLRDFDDVFRYEPQAGIEGRKKVVDDHREKFGRNWVILPNPAYGEWMKPLGNGEADANQLIPRLDAIQKE